PDQIRFGRAFIDRRRDPARFGRLYVAETALTQTGIKADARCALHPRDAAGLLAALANAFGANLPAPDLPAEAARFAAAAAADLRASEGRALVLVGDALAPELHALGHWINRRLKAPVTYTVPLDVAGDRAPSDLASLAKELEIGAVSCLAILGCNPVQTAPADLAFAEKLGRAGFSVHAGLHGDETAGATHWHLPLAHELESWSDLRALDGTASLVQPLVRPLYGGRSVHEILSLLSGEPATAGYDLVRARWHDQGGGDFEGWWRRALHDGVIPDSAAAAVDPSEARLPALPARPPVTGLAVELRADPCLYDGRYANNAWLQECPKPVSKQVWGNALALSAREAARRGLAAGDVVRLGMDGRAIEALVSVESGVAEGAGALTLGYGRPRAGAIGNGIGADGYRLATAAAPRLLAGVDVARLDRTGEVLRTQNYTQIEGETRKLFRQIALAELPQAKPKGIGADQPTLLDPWTGDADGHAWAMVIDTHACIGCNACVVACQSENNVPIVGPEEIARGRMMHWLRVDLYDSGTPEAVHAGFQPVPCMHCEHAPCEPVCPVAASVHDGEGLNLQVYNRCVGTRFCEANCPYKVRRFNFFGYADGQPYATMGAESIKAQHNPNVTV
ncbi:MAG: 4Fe-4S dicluster domain-containing protein, partial [Actinomycetospora chiangmaiensis]|nr:4Fe-4S dicluster domain-containing protein [Actinomycetospora chiangmaiensis]